MRSLIQLLASSFHQLFWSPAVILTSFRLGSLLKIVNIYAAVIVLAISRPETVVRAIE